MSRQRLRISKDLTIFYSSEGRPVCTPSRTPADIENEIQNYLRRRLPESEEFRFAEKWLEDFEQSRPAERVRGILDLYAKGTSRCCRAIEILLRSKDGESVSKCCLQCGKLHGVTRLELPDLYCEFCHARLSIRGSDSGDYHYVCERGHEVVKLASLLPHWSMRSGWRGPHG